MVLETRKRSLAAGMKMEMLAGLWIDHRKAVIVVITDEREETMTLASPIKKRTRFADSMSSKHDSTEDGRDRRSLNHLNKYYDDVIRTVRDAGAVTIFGPGEAKGELRKRFVHAGYAGTMLALETADVMTNRQISAKVRKLFWYPE